MYVTVQVDSAGPADPGPRLQFEVLRPRVRRFSHGLEAVMGPGCIATELPGIGSSYLPLTCPVTVPVAQRHELDSQ